MELVIHKCPICGKDGDEKNVCEACGRDNFSDNCFDHNSRRCLHCLWDPASLFAWADGCKIPAGKLPRDRNELTTMTKLSLTANAGIYSVATIPPELSNLTNLEELRIAAHPVKKFPAELAKLTRLTHVFLDTLELENIPDFIFELPRLERLSLMNNRLTTIPDRLAELTTLKCLILSSNSISTLPESIASLPQLQELYLWDNKLSTLPDSLFTNAPALKVLNVDGNPLDSWQKSHPDQFAQYATYIHYNK